MREAHRLLAHALAGCATLLARPAAACSCQQARITRVTVPADGARAFPTDGVVRVFVTALPAALRGALAGEYRLVDARGAAVPLAAAWVGTRLDLRPQRPLQPAARYTLERIFAYDEAGALVGDSERLDRWRNPAGLRRAWFAELSFETGTGPATRRAPGAVTLRETRAGVRHGGGDCGPGLALSTDFTLPASTAATDVIEFEVRGRGVAPMLGQTLPSAGATDAWAGDLLCTPDPVTIPYRPPLEARVVVRDAAGAAVATSAWAAAAGAPRLPLGAAWERNRRTASRADAITPELLRGWTAPPIIALTAAPPRGPAACPFGFETTVRRELAAAGSPWTYEQRSSLLFDGARGWLTLGAGRDDPASRLYALTPDAVATEVHRAVPGVWASAAGADTLVLVSRHHLRAEAPGAVLRGFAPSGASRWSTPFPANALGFHVAVGGGRALVTWSDRRALLAPPLGRALFDLRTGAAVGPSRVTEHAVDLNGAPASAWVGDRFLVAWPARAGSPPVATVHVAALTPDGALSTPRALPLPSDGPVDLASAGDRVALVAAHQGAVRWALLDRDGAVVRGPVVVSDGVGDGDNRKPRVTAADGLFAVTWETHPEGASYAVAVDAAGAVSPAHRLSGTATSSTGVVAAGAGRTFLAAYTTDYGHGWVSALRCRGAAPTGAPQRVAPASNPAPPPPL